MASTREVLDHARCSSVRATQPVAPSHRVPHPEGQSGCANRPADTGADENRAEDLTGADVQVAVVVRGAHQARTPDPGVIPSCVDSLCLQADSPVEPDGSEYGLPVVGQPAAP